MGMSRSERAELYQNGYPAPLLLAPDTAKDCEVYVSLNDILSHIERDGMNIVEDFVNGLPGPFYIAYNGSHHAWDFSLYYFTKGKKVPLYEMFGKRKMEVSAQYFVDRDILDVLYNKEHYDTLFVGASDRHISELRQRKELKKVSIDDLYGFIDENLEKAVKAWESSRENY